MQHLKRKQRLETQKKQLDGQVDTLQAQVCGVHVSACRLGRIGLYDGPLNPSPSH
jgi:hypothetical protein